jgi:acyl transferase domain-containing protein
MSSISEKLDQLSPLQRAVYALKETRSKLDAIQHQQTESIAIVGMGCRFPGGANNPDLFWQILKEGVDTIQEVPPERWNADAYYDSNPETPGKMYTRQGGFLDVGVDKFDADFFGLAPREVVNIDPQQRLLLEVSWEALEQSGYASDKLNGSQTGVFVGITTNDYAQLAMFQEITGIDIYTATGNALNVAAGRLSYNLGLQGPSMAIDTACSSSLVAVHLACQSLRTGECSMALAGGVSLILSPEVTIAMSKLRALAADGRCKTFDAGADGYGRGEGCGIVLLKRLSDAIADHDNILAVIKGSAVNQDGRSSGLTVPNGLAQQAVLRAALINAQVEPSQISYVEAHGTGTPLGDPIELKALAAVLGEGRSPQHPLIVGSVKTNIGHLEAASGIASLIKVVLAMQNQAIPPHLHLNHLNPHIGSQQLPVSIPTKLTPWTGTDDGQPSQHRNYLAGISSFGFSGTNAHIVVEAAPVRELKSLEVERPVHLLTLSAKSDTSLASLVEDFERYFETHPSVSLADVCFSANIGRSHFNHRLALVAESSAQIRQQLATFVAQNKPSGELNGLSSSISKPKVAFLFTGQGSQYVDMGRQLYDTQPTFRKTLEHCDRLLYPELGQSLLSVLYPEPGTPSLLQETAYAQPALFALEYALAELWQSWGMEPDVVMGHSVGEYVAACVAGVFSLEDGLKLIAQRAKLMQALPANGDMVAIFASEAQVRAAIEPYAQQISIAALNGANNTVISGHHDAVEAVLKQIQAEGVEYRQLSVSRAFHSPLMEPILAEFARIAAEIEYSTPQLLLISNLSGKPVEGKEIAQAEYWQRHIRETVRFSQSIQTLHEQGCKLFLEIGPHAILTGMGQRCLPNEAGVWLASLKKEQGDWQQILQSLGTLYEQGVNIDWCRFDQDYKRHRLSLPTYPFERQRYWKETAIPQQRGVQKVFGNLSHPLLAQRLASPLRQIQFESQFSLDSLPLVRDHQLFGTPLVNFVIYLEMALAGVMEAFGTRSAIIEDVFISQALTLSSNEVRPVQLILESEPSGKTAFQIFSLTNSDADTKASWKLHAAGKVSYEKLKFATSAEGISSFDVVQEQYEKEISPAEFYQMMRDRGADLGSSCQWLERVWRGYGMALGKIRQPETAEENYQDYQLSVGVIDACFQLLAASLPDSVNDYMLVGVESFRFDSCLKQPLWGNATINLNEGNETILGQVRVFDEAGKLVIEVLNAQLRRVSREVLERAARATKSTTQAPYPSLSREQLLAVEPGERQLLLETYLLERLAKALQLPLSKLKPQQSLASLVDSLITVELKNQIEADLQVAVPVTKFFETINIIEFANFILEQLNPEPLTLSSSLQQVDDQTLAQVLLELEGLSEAEVQIMLATKIQT